MARLRWTALVSRKGSRNFVTLGKEAIGQGIKDLFTTVEYKGESFGKSEDVRDFDRHIKESSSDLEFVCIF
ncbi:hypothetical protein EPI10_005832 [Gossypium australe]|uniref:Uncharacterized protein n=1 Tax=Gossypium australe TaxID=47621 RepID=A0A5B6WR44_9ROSI|nr:hypothetical protein EPI10_005832 [Gossypium australe]